MPILRPALSQLRAYLAVRPPSHSIQQLPIYPSNDVRATVSALEAGPSRPSQFNPFTTNFYHTLHCVCTPLLLTLALPLPLPWVLPRGRLCASRVPPAEPTRRDTARLGPSPRILRACYAYRRHTHRHHDTDISCCFCTPPRQAARPLGPSSSQIRLLFLLEISPFHWRRFSPCQRPADASKLGS